MKKMKGFASIAIILCALAVFFSPVKGEAFIESLVYGIARDAISSAAVEQAANSPSAAFLSMLQSASLASGVNVDGKMAVKLWKATGRPQVNTAYRMEQVFKKIMRACNIKAYEVATIKDTDQVMLDPDVMRELFANGAVMVAFLQDMTSQNRSNAYNTSHMLWRTGWNVGLYSAFSIGADVARAAAYKNVEQAVAVVGMSGRDAVIVGEKGKLMAIPMEDLEMSEFIVAIMGKNRPDRTGLKADAAVAVSEDGTVEEVKKRETKVSAESEDYIEKMRRELKEKGKM